jgi:hypothetical protein
MSKTEASERLRYRLRRIDRKPDDRIPDVAYTDKEEANEASTKIRGFATWGEVYSYYIGKTSGTQRSAEARRKRPKVDFALSAEMVGYVERLAAKQGRTKTDVIVEGIELVKKRHGDA